MDKVIIPAVLQDLWNYTADWRFVIGETWLSTWMVPVTVVPVYFALVYGLDSYVRGKIERKELPKGEGFGLKPLVIVHNFAMSFLSLLLFVLLAYELIVMVNASSFGDVFCDEKIMWNKGRQHFYYYINFFFKFVELFDTILLALRNKPLMFLHVYHHAATLVLCWSQLRGESCMQWVPIIINLAIHVVMYYYYAQHARGIRVWWKKYLTIGQIIQFVVGLTACVVALGSRILFLSGYTQFPKCHGYLETAFFGVGILFSYLILFIDLYRKTYDAKKKKAAEMGTVGTKRSPSKSPKKSPKTPINGSSPMRKRRPRKEE